MYIEYEKGEKYPRPNAAISDFHEQFEDAGYILNKNDLIIDIDGIDRSVIKEMCKEFNIKTHTVWTDRGAHLYFQKPNNFRAGNMVCCLGFLCEYKTNKSNKSVTVKRFGKMREIDNPGVFAELPSVFANRNKRYQELIGLSEGDGRNNKLRDHRIALQDCEGFEKILKFINKCIFDEPLDDKEMQNTILRKDFKISLNGETQTAKYLIKEKQIKLVGERLFYYDGVRYINDDIELKRSIFAFLGESKSKTVEEVFKQIQLSAPKVDFRKAVPVKFKNGVLKDGEFVEMDYNDFTYYYVDIDYKHDAKAIEIVDEYLKMLSNDDKTYIDLLLEVLGHTLITDAEMKRMLAKFFIFVGDGGNGKGTLLEIIRKILGNNNCSSLSIKQMTDERYLPNIAGKLANLGDDIEGSAINDKDMKVLKNVSTCDAVEIRRMYSNSYSETITASLIFTSNHIIKSFEKGESYKRRVLWLNMFNKPKKKDPKFITKITSPEALAYWVKLIVDGYMRLYKNQKFTHCQIIEDWNNEYHEENDVSMTYVSDFTKEYFEGKKPTDIAKEYEQWCEDNDATYSKKMLYESIQKQFGLTSRVCKINKQTVRIFQ